MSPPSLASRRPWARWLVRALVVVVACPLLLFGGLVAFEWRPALLTETPIHNREAADAGPQSTISLLSWNLGYAGLGADADFFMDGGKQVSPPSEAGVRRNLAALADRLRVQPADVVLLQEVDGPATRTFGVDQVAEVTGALPRHAWARALNFVVTWIPYPLFEPLGRANSGLVSLARQRPTEARRHQLPGAYPWPVRVFHLKRCLHELRLPAPDGKDWAVLHLHLSAFDKGGTLRREQMTYLGALIRRLHAEGHHVVVGGDWNQAFPGVPEYPHQAQLPTWLQHVPDGWTPEGWTWAFDPATPSLRATNRPYEPGVSFVTTVDGFLLGPDVRLVSVSTGDLGFEHSDHHPVRVEVTLDGS